MAYTPIDDAFTADGRTLPAKLAQTLTDNAQWLWDNRHNAWSLYWPTGKNDDAFPTDFAAVTGMVYTAAHGENSRDYTGLYLSTPPGEPMSINVPLPTTGRGNRIRVRMSVRFEDTITSDGSVFVWATLTDIAGVYPRTFVSSDLVQDYTGTPAIPRFKSTTYPGAVEVTNASNNAGGWTVITIDVDLPDVTATDSSPATRDPGGVPQLTISFLSAYPDADSSFPTTAATLAIGEYTQVSPVQITVGTAFTSGLNAGTKPHQWLLFEGSVEPGVVDAQWVDSTHSLCVREVDDVGTLSLFFWPPAEIASTITVIDAPALRVFAIRVEETNQ